MRRTHAAAGSALFFLLAPGTVAGLIPWLITGWEIHSGPVARVLGGSLIVVGLVPLVAAFVEFARADGTPAPPAPTERLVVTGFNRYVRNPMYIGVVTTIVGQALLFGSLSLLLYAAAVWAATAAFVHLYEEPTLALQHGQAYESYRRTVRAWLPNLHPYHPPREQDRPIKSA
jgi:protein-S-isoprenylcysteine O-methyltransferase Ste14